MHHSEKAKFLEVLAGVHDFYGRELTEFAGKVWWEAVQGFDLEQVTKAMSVHLMDPERGQFMPRPADLVRALHGTHADRSLIAWGKVLDAVKRVGAYQSVVFDDGAIHAAIQDIGGWTKICRSQHDELPFLQKRFCDAHRAYSMRPETAYPSKLWGEHELTNSMQGHEVPQPMLIGDPAKARAVLADGAAGSKTLITAANALPRIERKK